MSDAIANALRIASRQTERNPTDAQKEAGNYAKGKLRWNGLEIAIENPKGGERSGVDKGGKRWSVKMPAHYGYVKGTEGRDGDHVDTYIGPDHASDKVFVIDQVDADTGRFDEHKCCLSYPSKSAALADYEKAFSDGKAKDRIGAVTEMSVEDFKGWLRNGNTKKPLGNIRKGYATGGAVTMPLIKSGSKQAVSKNISAEIKAGKPRKQAIAIALDVARRAKRADGGAVTFSKESVTLSPADQMLRGYADGGVPDWRSNMDVEGGIPLGGPRSDFLREPARGEDPTLPIGERIREGILDYGPIPAKLATEMLMAPGVAIGEALVDPTLANITNAGVQTALGVSPFAPLRAGKAALGVAGLGYGTAASRDLGLSPFDEARAEEDGLSPAQRQTLMKLQKKMERHGLSRAERETQNQLMQIQADFAREKSRAAFEAQVRRDAADAEAKARERELVAEGEAKRKAEELAEYSRAVKGAERALAEEKGRYKPFSETFVGDLYDKLGIATPALAAMGAGGLSRTAARLFGKEGSLVETIIPAFTGAGTAGVMANWPLGHEIVFAPAENPERRAYEAYARELPPTHPRKQEWTDYARGLPESNPSRKAAVDEFYDPIKLAERTGFGIAEGLISGPGGAHISKIIEKTPSVIARTPGTIGKAFYESMGDAAKARNQLLKTRRSGEELLGSGDELGRIEPEFRRAAPSLQRAEDELSQGMSEARRRLGEPGGVSDLSEAGVPPRQRPRGEALPSPSERSPLSDPKGKAEKVKKQETDAKKLTPAYVERALRALTQEETIPEVVMLTRDKLGRKQFRTPEGRYRGGPVTERSAFGRALDIARKYAAGGRVLAGPVVGNTGGREDAKPVDVASGSFVVPADIVSHLGTGNSLAGMDHLKKVFGEPVTRASGGAVPIKISDGEYVLTPEQVAKIGGGDMQKGHKILDQMVLKLRKQHIDTLKGLPPPAKD